MAVKAFNLYPKFKAEVTTLLKGVSSGEIKGGAKVPVDTEANTKELWKSTAFLRMVTKFIEVDAPQESTFAGRDYSQGLKGLVDSESARLKAKVHELASTHT